MSAPRVIAVCADAHHNTIKPTREQIDLVAGFGVKGDAHYGRKVQHLYDMRRNPDAPNLRQVHLIHAELFDEVAEAGFAVMPGQMGENITTRGIDLLHLPRGTRLSMGEAEIEITGLRNPCRKLNKIQDGLMKATLGKWDDGTLLPKTGVMAIITRGGVVRAGDVISVQLPDGPHERLAPV